jgi:hypothetical protein
MSNQLTIYQKLLEGGHTKTLAPLLGLNSLTNDLRSLNKRVHFLLRWGQRSPWATGLITEDGQVQGIYRINRVLKRDRLRNL